MCTKLYLQPSQLYGMMTYLLDVQLNILLCTASNFLIYFSHNTFNVNNTFFVDAVKRKKSSTLIISLEVSEFIWYLRAEYIKPFFNTGDCFNKASLFDLLKTSYYAVFCETCLKTWLFKKMPQFSNHLRTPENIKSNRTKWTVRCSKVSELLKNPFLYLRFTKISISYNKKHWRQ